MRRLIGLLLLLFSFLFVLLVVSGVHAEEEEATTTTTTTEKEEEVPIADLMKDVPSLVDETYDDYLESHDAFMIEFYSPWCGYCRSLVPVILEAHKQSEIPIVKVDAIAQPGLATRYGVKAYPTLIFIKNQRPIKYEGQRSVSDIVHYMKRAVREKVFDTITSTDQLKEETSKSNLYVLGVVSEDKASKEYKRFARFAEEVFDFNKVVHLGVTTDRSIIPPEIFQDYTLPSPDAPTLIVFKPKEKPRVYTGDWTVSLMLVWFKVSQEPLVSEVGPSNYPTLTEKGRPLYLFWVNYTEPSRVPEYPGLEKDRIVDMLYKLAAKFTDITFGYADGVQYEQVLGQFALQKGILPALSVIKVHDTNKYVLQEPGLVLTEELLEKHINDYLAGNLAPYVKKKPIPESPLAEDGVREIVYDNFEEVVLADTTKDVLVEFFVPWCAHCKALAPHYAELVALFKDVENIELVKMDMDSNDMPPSVKPLGIVAYPTFYYWPAKDKAHPIKFEGDAHDLKQFVKWIKEHKTVKANIPKVKETKVKEAKEEAEEEEEVPEIEVEVEGETQETQQQQHGHSHKHTHKHSPEHHKHEHGHGHGHEEEHEHEHEHKHEHDEREHEHEDEHEEQHSHHKHRGGHRHAEEGKKHKKEKEKEKEKEKKESKKRKDEL